MDGWAENGGGVGSGLESLAHPTSAGTGAFGGVFSTPYPWVWVSCLASLLVGVVLGLLSTVLAARPMFHRTRDAIEAHLTIVFTALAVSRSVQNRTGLAIANVVKQLRPLRSATIAINGTTQTFAPEIPAGKQAVLDAIQGPKLTHPQRWCGRVVSSDCTVRLTFAGWLPQDDLFGWSLIGV